MEDKNRQGVGSGDKVAGGSGPGSDNPALDETYAEQAGEISTADLLRVRESAEEQRLRDQKAEIYADQSPGAGPDQWRDIDAGRPNWPAERDRSPGEYMESPRADAAYLSGSGAGGGSGADTQQLEAEADALADRTGSQAARGEARSGIADPGADPEEDIYAREEWTEPQPPSEMDMFAPGMVNLPPEDDGER